MKQFTALIALAASVQAHYTFPALVYGGVRTGDWQYVRQWTGYYSNGPVTSVSSLDIRCNVGASSPAVGARTSTLPVTAGSTLGFTASISHPGTLQIYMAKVPSGQTASSWDGSGNVWFKVFGQGPVISGGSLSWPSLGASQVLFTIPRQVPNGDYLVRVEHIALHSASSPGGAQFYISCGQITVTGGGNGNPGPLVAFPGAYQPTDPGLMISIYWPIPTSYTLPGPAVWSG